MFTQIAPKPGLIHVGDTMLSDMYKDAYNVRPRHYKIWWTKDELVEEYNYLQKEIEISMNEEAEREAVALVDFEKLVQKTIEDGAGDRETAIRWLVDAEDLNMNESDLKYFFWGYGLSYEIQNEWSVALTQ